MTTIKEDFVSFETAKLLKEKGFDEPIQYFYKFDSKELYRGTVFTNTQIGDKFYNTPTLQMVMKWLREKYNLFIQITVDFSDGAYPMYDVCVVNLAICTSIIVNGYNRYSYTQACEIAIKYCLENLIV